MDKKTAVVTGGANGIGRAIALKLCEWRYSVIVADTDEKAGRDMVSAYQKIYDIHFVATDVSNEIAVKKLAEKVKRDFSRLDALVNNAGIADAHNKPLPDLKFDEWNQKIQANLGGAFLCSKYFQPFLKKAKGSIVNIASTRAQMSEPNTEAYSVSKGGIVALTHAMANSLGPEIRVNAVSPGWIITGEWQKSAGRGKPELRKIDHEQHPVGRVGYPEDIAHIVTFLLSERAGFITGQNIVVDGGMTRKMMYAE